MDERFEAELLAAFDRINATYFDSFLDRPILRWNSRLRACAGRFFPGSRKFWKTVPPIIEVAAYLRQEEKAAELISDTIAHEMIHYWLWVRRRPYGHTTEFLDKMRLMGVSRYNQAPRLRRFHYVYRCQGCGTEFPTRKRLGVLACAKCCKTHAGGRFDSRFMLLLDRQLSALEAAQLVQQRV